MQTKYQIVPLLLFLFTLSLFGQNVDLHAEDIQNSYTSEMLADDVIGAEFLSEFDKKDTLPLGKTKAGDLINHDYTPLIVKLSDDGKKYVRFILWNQMWARQTSHNPGTIGSNGQPMSQSFDIGIRRSRVLMYAQVSPRFLLLTHFGINNQTFFNGGARGQGVNLSNDLPVDGKKPQIFIHDAWNEYMLIKDKLYIGSGLHYWLGLSRMTNGSTLNFMTLDAPILNWPLIERTDQFARQMGIYAKGMLGGFSYRGSVNKPFVSLTAPTGAVAIDVPNDNLAYSYYLEYQFLERESNVLPYKVGTYLGTKHVFNLGFGAYHAQDATASKFGEDELEFHNMNLYGVDIFYERPLSKGKAFNIYSVYYRYLMGPEYIRNVGIMNYGLAGAPDLMSFNGAGNAQPIIGTGHIWYTQTGYLFPKLNNDAQIMPYATLTYKNFEHLQNTSWQYDLGVNYFINGHNAKITLQYSNRPIFNQQRQRVDYRGEFILQTQIFL